MFYGWRACTDSILEPLLPAQYTGKHRENARGSSFCACNRYKNIFSISCFEKDVQIQQIRRQDKADLNLYSETGDWMHSEIRVRHACSPVFTWRTHPALHRKANSEFVSCSVGT